MFGSPNRLLCEQVVDDVRRSSSRHKHRYALPQVLHGAFYTSSHDCPGIGSLFDVHLYGKWAPLFGGFVQRERILSTAVFVPDAPVIHGNEKPEILFFNFRTQHAFSETQKFELALLANVILASVDTELKRRQKHWQPALLWTTRCQSSLTSIFNDALVYHSAEQREEHFVEHLLGNLHQYLVRPGGDNERLLASVYLLKNTPNGMTLNRCGRQWGAKEEKAPLAEQRCYREDEASITVCTATTGRSHLLNHIDPPGQTSIELMQGEYSRLVTTDLPPQYILRPPRKREPARLILFDPEGEFGGERIKNTIPIPRVEDKLLVRNEVQFADLFGELDSEWSRPCSEVCVPIYAGQQIVGCVNIESDQTYRFNPSSLNVLGAVSTIVGAAVMQRDSSRLLDEIQTASELFHTERHPDPESLRLDELASQVARTLGCYAIDIEIAVGINEGEAVYTTIATSRDDETTLQTSKWSSRVAGAFSDSVNSIVVDIDKSRRSETPSVYIIRQSAQTPVAAAPGSCRFALSAIDDFEFDIEDAATDPPIDIIIGVALGDPEAREVTAPRAILWASYLHRPFAIDDEQWANSLRRDGQLQYLFSTAARCSVIPLTWSSEALAAIRFNRAMHHGGLIDTMEKISAELSTVSRRYGSSDERHEGRALSMSIGKAAGLSDYLCSHLNVTRRLAATNHSNDLADLIERLKLKHEWPLQKLLDEAWQVVVSLYTHRSQELTLNLADGLRIVGSRDEVSELLILVLTNCVLHGKRADGVRDIVVDAVVRSEGIASVRIYDHGESTSLDSTSYRNTKEQPRLGVSTIKKLAGAICHEGKYTFVPPSIDGGVSWEFVFPVCEITRSI